ncbi:MAG: Ig-like domain-containing protein [bacterium]
MRCRGLVPVLSMLVLTALISSCNKSNSTDPLPGPGGDDPGTGGSIAITVAADPNLIIGDGTKTSRIAATVRDSDGKNVGPGVTVAFAASRGEIASPVLTDQNGQAFSTYTSDVGSGLVQINASVGASQGVVSLSQTSGPASQIVLVSVQRTSIGIRGSGDPESSTLLFQVRSAQGVPLGSAESVTVDFELVAKTNNGQGSGEFLSPASATSDANGFVSTTLNSGTIAGATETIARITTATGTIASRVVPVTIDGGLPVAANLTVASQESNIPGLCFYNVRTQVLGLVYDEFQNPVPEGTVVYFSTQYGGVQATDTTDAFGVANVDLISANQLPPVWDGSGNDGYPYGFTEVYAQTSSASGAQIRDTTLVLFSGCTILENVSPASFIIENGGCQTFTFNLWDLNHNPLSAGTKITVSATTGSLNGDINVTLPDVQAGYTTFAFGLCDNDPDEEDEAVAVFISIQITSRNNNASALISGTID